VRSYEETNFKANRADMNIAVAKSDLDKIGADSIKVPGEENQYIAGLGVYHELHCLVGAPQEDPARF
jgi:hypothetical protein